eukprot:Opistho-1_new@83464
MSFRLKAAIFAAFTLSAAAAVSASDMSIAGETIPSAASLSRDNALAMTAPAVVAKPAVTFSAPREIVQPLVSAPKAASDFSTPSDFTASSLAALVDAHGAPESLDGDMQPMYSALI